MTVTEMIYETERRTLSPYAFLTENTRGRDEPIRSCCLRGEFQRDRDRIIHSKAFRRLMHKTQVFLSPEADHYRTRLTHTLEVSQVARSIARALRLNEDLCEAIALGHDLGHTPFGHAGERVLQRCFDPSFTHYAQSIRVVEKLEKLNLTWEVRDGILHHTTGGASTLEGQIILEADRIAYINHDIDDACRAGILTAADIPAELSEGLGQTPGERINTMVMSIIRASEEKPEIRMEPAVRELTDRLHAFLYETVYRSPIAKGEEGKAEEMLAHLYAFFAGHPERLPAEFRLTAETESPARAACDYIACMTDRYAVNLYQQLFIPAPWRG